MLFLYRIIIVFHTLIRMLIIGITGSWANTNVTGAELRLTGYVMFRRNRIGRRGGGVILYVKESIQAYEIKLERKQITMKMFGAK